MFKTNPPQFFAHKSALENFVTHKHIITHNSQGELNAYNRRCPHRGYLMGEPGYRLDDQIICKFHGFKFDKDGNSIDCKCSNLPGKLVNISRSGLIYKNWIEPNHFWVDELEKETNFIYEHSKIGHSSGSWLWMMDVESDLLHVRKGGIHPKLAQQLDVEKDIKCEQGDDWVIQIHPNGWWLFVYPFLAVDYYRPGQLAITYTVPDNKTEYGFSWISQYYYNPDIPYYQKDYFETFVYDVWLEDVAAIEKLDLPFFPLKKSTHWLEDHSVHFGEWYNKNRRYSK